LRRNGAGPEYAVRYIRKQPEHTEAGAVGQARQLQCVRPVHQHFGGDAVQTIRTKMRQDMPIKIPPVGLPAPLGLAHKGQIAFLNERAEQRLGMERQNSTDLLSDNI